jgi:hypothetical protein
MRAKKPGMYCDVAGLYLQVNGDGARHITKSWICRFTLRGRTREMGLGSFAALGLADARTKASECRRLTLDGIDPIEACRAERTQAALESAKVLTSRSAPKGMSPRTVTAGAIASTPRSGTPRSRPMPSRKSVHPPCRMSTPRADVVEEVRNGRAVARSHRGRAAGRRGTAFARARTLRDGAGISTSCSRGAVRAQSEALRRIAI